MEGSQGQTAVDVKEANKRETTCDDTKYNVLASSRKSIIEEWRNPPKYSEDLLRSDQTYEERAVDVIIDDRPQEYLKRFPQNASSLKITNNDVNKISNDDKLIKIKRPQGGGTVRSIPIKDYQASIAYNIGTLRRSVAPQLQFETLVSEPEKSVYMSSKKIIPITSNLHHRTSSQITCTAEQMEADNARKRSLCHFCNNQSRDSRGCCSADPNKNEENRYFSRTKDQKSQDGSDIDEYFHRSSRRRFSSNYDHRPSKCTHESSGNIGMATCTKDEKAMENTDALRVAQGHVGQKISAYEQNARRSLRDSNPRYRSLFEVKGHRGIGVPLVGMHNACGLPVVASWHNHELLLDPLRIARTVRSVYKGPRTVPNVRRRTQKRKAPQPDRAMIHSRDVDHNVTRSTIKSVGHSDNVNSGERSRRKHRRSSFTTKAGSLSSKNSFKKTTRSKRHGIKVSSLVDTFGRIKAGSAKRTTLYAKDDGEEAVQVLKNLCLNPLARANPEIDMMW